jgi:hypothetical protein
MVLTFSTKEDAIAFAEKNGMIGLFLLVFLFFSFFLLFFFFFVQCVK